MLPKKNNEISRNWARYRLSLKGRITITKVFLFPQFVYNASVLDPSEGTYEQINRYIRNFVNSGSTLASGDRNWIYSMTIGLI